MSTGTDASDFLSKTPKSAELQKRATRVFPSGITHDVRYLEPHPIFVERAAGSRKWDVDGNEYVDYFGGHGALILGHSHPAVVEAVAEQVSKGTHYGGSHELELEWGELVAEMIPCAEKVRFTASGTEASMLGFRIARAFTGKSKILRFAGHFHGWHDQVAFSGGDLPGGIPSGMAEAQVVCPANDIEAVRQAVAADDDIAAIVLEPTGATFGKVPTSPEFLSQLRALSEQHRILLIFDEVISGFRVAPGGAQGFYGIVPDMAFLAKIIAGGYPGGAVVGRADVMDGMTVRPNDPQWNSAHRVAHMGTFNANPISAVAGLTTLRILATTDVIERVNSKGAAIRDGMNQAIRELGLGWVVYGKFSEFHIFVNPENVDVTIDDIYSLKPPEALRKGGTPAATLSQLRTGLIAHGVDIIPWPGGMASAVHADADIDRTISGFKQMAAELMPAVA